MFRVERYGRRPSTHDLSTPPRETPVMIGVYKFVVSTTAVEPRAVERKTPRSFCGF